VSDRLKAAAPSPQQGRGGGAPDRGRQLDFEQPLVRVSTQLDEQVAAPPQFKLQVMVHPVILHTGVLAQFNEQLPPAQSKTHDFAPVQSMLQLPLGQLNVTSASLVAVAEQPLPPEHSSVQVPPSNLQALPTQGSVSPQLAVSPAMRSANEPMGQVFMIVCPFLFGSEIEVYHYTPPMWATTCPSAICVPLNEISGFQAP